MFKWPRRDFCQLSGHINIGRLRSWKANGWIFAPSIVGKHRRRMFFVEVECAGAKYSPPSWYIPALKVGDVAAGMC